MRAVHTNKNDKNDALARLQQIIATLRSEKGCPWDIKQTPASLKKYLLEECHELADALEKDQEKEICEEIGDVLFILFMLINIFSEQGRFTADAVLEQINEKMIRRHPHVFAGVPIADEQALHAQWERIKALEKKTCEPSGFSS